MIGAADNPDEKRELEARTRSRTTAIERDFQDILLVVITTAFVYNNRQRPQ
jgi:hypothetical protein